jgi:hypothetical protein
MVHGLSSTLWKPHCSTSMDAIGFRGSPSILVNGTDAFPDPSAPFGLSCRNYATPDGFAGAPTLDQLRAVIRTT